MGTNTQTTHSPQIPIVPETTESKVDIPGIALVLYETKEETRQAPVRGPRRG